MKYNYYASEINKLNTNSSYPWSIVIRDGEGGKTKHLNINKESIQVLRDMLTILETNLEYNIEDKGE